MPRKIEKFLAEKGKRTVAKNKTPASTRVSIPDSGYHNLTLNILFRALCQGKIPIDFR
jgi:hypothetical protein